MAALVALPAEVRAWLRWLRTVGCAVPSEAAGTPPGTVAGLVRSIGDACCAGAETVFGCCGRPSSETMAPSGRESTVAASTEVGTEDQGTESMRACVLRSPEGRMLEVSKVCATSGTGPAPAAKRCRSVVKRLSRRGTPGCDTDSR